MKRLFGILSVIIFSAVIAAAQTPEKKNPPPPPAAGDKAQYLDRLISQNYINIRDLRSSVINYGGGQQQFNVLLDGFSAAFAKYLSEQKEESAKLFEKNDTDIKNTASGLAKKYQKDTDDMYSQLIKIAVKDRMDKSINRNNVETEMDLSSPNDFYLKSAAHLMRIGDLRITENNPIEAIFYYRKSKQYIFQSYTEMGIAVEKRFDKDIADMRGEIYVPEEKKKTK